MDRAIIEQCFNGARAVFEQEIRTAKGKVVKFHPSISQGRNGDIGFRIEFQVCMWGTGKMPAKTAWFLIYGDDIQSAAKAALDSAVDLARLRVTRTPKAANRGR